MPLLQSNRHLLRGGATKCCKGTKITATPNVYCNIPFLKGWENTVLM